MLDSSSKSIKESKTWDAISPYRLNAETFYFINDVQ